MKKRSVFLVLVIVVLIGVPPRACEATLTGDIVAWGYNGNGQCNVPAGDDFVAIAGGYYHSLALVGPSIITVNIDIKPGSLPNSINLKSKGVVPVAVLTTEDFDADTVDPETLVFADALPIRWTMEDVDGDGDLDILFHFRTQELNLTKESTEASLRGETLDGTPIAGTDSVNIVPKGKK